MAKVLESVLELVLLRLPLTRIPFGRTLGPRLILPGLTHNPLAASYLILAAPAGHIHTSTKITPTTGDDASVCACVCVCFQPKA